PWTSNRLKRLVRSPKRYVVDPGLIGAVLRLDANATLRDGDLLGRVLDTFVTAQLRAELAVSDARPRLYHPRREQGRREVDLLAELAAGRVVAVEVKADAAPGRGAANIWAGCETSSATASSAGCSSIPVPESSRSRSGSSPHPSAPSGREHDPSAVSVPGQRRGT
ncbi:MAG: DUF4143 domain-containing protein, partial [Actinomycetota bacterium]|nr:DUF4143 domain-containing protein [Actinomycetota bacterium]